MISSSHQIFQSIFFLLKFYLTHFFFIDQIIATNTKYIKLFKLIFKHKLKFLDMGFIKLGALKSLFF